MDFLLDPYVVAVPEVISSAQDLAGYVQSLRGWVETQQVTKHRFWFTSFLAIALTADGTYPYPSVLQNRSRFTLGLDDVLDLQTVHRVIQKVLMEPPYLDDEIEIENIDFELIESVVLPSEIENRLSSGVALALKKSLVVLGVATARHHSDLAQSVIFATNPLHVQSSCVEVDMNMLEETDVWGQLSVSWPLIVSPEQLDEMEGLLNFWRDTTRSVKWAFSQLVRNNALSDGEHICPKFKVGDAFNKIIEDNHYDNQPALLDMLFKHLVLALVGVGGYEPNGKKHHILRNDDAPTSAPIIRGSDGAVAWRIWISSGRPAYRLHYWRLPNGEVEISKIGVHEDYTII